MLRPHLALPQLESPPRRRRQTPRHTPPTSLPPRRPDNHGSPMRPRRRPHWTPHLRMRNPNTMTRPRLTAHQRGYGWRWQQLRLRILLRDSYVCHYCGNHANSVDHVHPKADGGTDDPANLVACCIPCNSKRSVAAQARRRRVLGAARTRYASNMGTAVLGTPRTRYAPRQVPRHGSVASIGPPRTRYVASIGFFRGSSLPKTTSGRSIPDSTGPTGYLVRGAPSTAVPMSSGYLVRDPPSTDDPFRSRPVTGALAR